MNWISNISMKALLERIEQFENIETLRTNISHLTQLFVPNFRKVKDCILISDKSQLLLEEHFETALTMYGDKTGYEASNTETRINCYFEDTISVETGTQIAMLIVPIWAVQLKALEPESTFCFIVCSDTDKAELRFHKVRDGERWLASDINSYPENEAIGYVYI